MRVIGIDPGTATTGYGVVDNDEKGLKLVEYGTIKTSPKQPSHERLLIISEDLERIIKKFSPDDAAVELLFFSSNSKTAIKVGEARGAILLTTAKTGVKLYEYTPLQVKQALTGYGRADKKQIQYMVKTILKLPVVPKPDDAADAIAIAICHINSRRVKQLYDRSNKRGT